MAQHTFTLSAHHHGQRLDKVVIDVLVDEPLAFPLTRSAVQRWLADGGILLNGTLPKAAQKVKTGDVLSITPTAPEALNAAAENIPLHILYEDDHLLVVNKPAGMAVHPAAGSPNGTLVNALVHHCGTALSSGGQNFEDDTENNQPPRPGIVHRLDKGTSGVMVVAKTDAAHQHLAAQFKQRSAAGEQQLNPHITPHHPAPLRTLNDGLPADGLQREYIALCYGLPPRPAGELHGAIGRSPNHRKKMAVVGADKGKPAVTRYITERTFNHSCGAAFSLLRLKLLTGRTHQIRVHLAAAGCPVVGDPLYSRTPTYKNAPALNAKLTELSHQLLHAATLGFMHPTTQEELLLSAPLPNTFSALIEFLK